MNSANYVTTTSSTTQVSDGFLVGVGAGTIIVTLAIAVLMIVAQWKIFEKAGQPGWAALIPIYDIIVMLRVIKMEWWHVLIMIFIPFASVVYAIIIPVKLAKVFGQSTAFGVLSIFFSVITYPILAFGKAKYEG